MCDYFVVGMERKQCTLYVFALQVEVAVVCVCVYGFAAKDASFAGQGVCYETMQLAHVKEFDVGGTIHVIINNQATGMVQLLSSPLNPLKHLPAHCWFLDAWAG